MMNRLDLGLSLSLNSPWSTPLIPLSAEENESRERDEQEQEQERVSSPDSTISSISLKWLERTGSGNTGSKNISDEEDGGDGFSRKKLRLSKEQSAILEECFKSHSTLNPQQKQALAAQLSLRPRQVEVWFQNRRARTKLKQTEVDCEYLKRWCERLTDENKRLQKEVAELRALKAATSSRAILAPAMTTLTMCPSCQKVSSGSNAANLFRTAYGTTNTITTTATTTATAAAVITAPASASTSLPNYCQFFPISTGSNQNMWTATAATSYRTRELF